MLSDFVDIEHLIRAARAEFPQAEAIALVGSLARSTEHPLSDIDLLCIGEGMAEYQLSVLGPRLLALQGKTATQVRDDLNDPAVCAQAVPSWRSARILFDPLGTATALRHEAQTWCWEQVQERLEPWAAQTVCGYAEEGLKLIAATRAGRTTAAQVQAHLIAVHLTPVMAAVNHTFFESENALWDGTAGNLRWYTMLSEAMQAPPAIAARTAIALLLAAGEATESWMTPTQREVILFVRRNAKDL